MERLQGAAVSEDTSTLLQQLEEALSSLHQKDAKCQELSLEVRILIFHPDRLLTGFFQLITA